MKRNVILYVRVSTDEQGEKNLSLPSQIEKLKKYCLIKGLSVLEIFEERYSAWKTFDRPEYSKLRKYILANKNKVDYLLFTQWSRFSRDSGNAQTELKTLLKLGIEANAIEQWVDLSIPENLYMLSFYLAAPQVENDRLSLRVKDALRRGLKDGKWMGKAPYGYYNDKVLKQIFPNPQTKDIVSFAFKTFSTRAYSIEEVRRMAMERGLCLKKQQFINMLSNKFYIGKIYIKAYADEQEQYIQGIHQPIIHEDIFNKVQDILNGKRKPYQGKTNGTELPLKGYLTCPLCKRIMTGSASKSRNGEYYHYYHCQRKYGCKGSFRARHANEAFEYFLSRFQVSAEVISLYYLILEDTFQSNDKDKKEQRKAVESHLNSIQTNIQSLDDKMMNDGLPVERYNRLMDALESQKKEIQHRLSTLNESTSEYKKYIQFSSALLCNIMDFYNKSPLSTKHKIIGSIFPENFEFDGKTYRTTRINQTFELICKLSKGFKKEKVGKNTDQSTLAPLTLQKLNLLFRI